METGLTARDVYEKLTPKERRERLFVSPAYRMAYNRILDGEDRMTLPRYFWRKWLPVLGAEAASLYVVLRDISRVEAAGSDSWCWPEQSELGRRIGVSKNTLRKALGVLEKHGFIRSERRRDPRPGSWREVQGTNHYEVYLDIPLIPEDAVDLLLAEISEYAQASEFKFCTQSGVPVESALSSSSALRASEFKSCTQSDEGSRTVSSSGVKICALNVSNVDNVPNVSEARTGKGTFRDHPVVKAMSADERRRRESLAAEIGETLSRMEGSRGGGSHKSLGLHRRVAYLMPVSSVKEALAAVRDIADDQRAGRKAIGRELSAYFAGIIFQLAKRDGINLGIRRGLKRATKSTHGSMAPGAQGRTATPNSISGRRPGEGSPIVARDLRQAMRSNSDPSSPPSRHAIDAPKGTATIPKNRGLEGVGSVLSRIGQELSGGKPGNRE